MTEIIINIDTLPILKAIYKQTAIPDLLLHAGEALEELTTQFDLIVIS